MLALVAPVSTPVPVVVPGSVVVTGNEHHVSVVSTATPTNAGALEDFYSPTVARALTQAADLTKYTPQQMSTVREWVLVIPDASQVGVVAQRLGGGRLEPTRVLEGTYVYTPPVGRSVASVVSDLKGINAISLFYPLTRNSVQKRAIPDDPLFPDQWHLFNTGQNGGQPGEDANVTDVWDSYRGRGVNIAIVDDGLEHSHPDLAANYDPSISFDFIGNDPDPSPSPIFAVGDDHGTAVAGVAAAQGFNMLGVTGVAPDAILGGLRLISGEFGNQVNDMIVARALSFRNDAIDIYNNSWGPADSGSLADRTVLGGPLTMAALENAVRNGRGGLGNIFVFAAGNGLLNQDNINYDSLANSRFVIAVTAVDNNGQQSFYAEPGAAILVAAHSAGLTAGITTTDRVGDQGYNFVDTAADGDPLLDLDYTSQFGGTSSAAPLVSGVIALMLEANPNLTYRDVQHILVETARVNDPTDVDWMLNGAGYFVNHKYGFGVIDAEAAVAAAENWTTVNPEISVSTGVITVGLPIPDNNVTGVSSTVDVNSDVDLNIEHIEVRFTAPHTYSGDLEVVLTSPSGTRSILAEQRIVAGAPGAYDNWSFSTVRHWGESINGEWTITVRDLVTGDVGTFDSYELIFYGTEREGNKLRGHKWNDLDRDGVRDANEPGLAGFTFYVDQNNNGILDPHEPSAVSDANGNYVIDTTQLINQFGFGNYVVREVDRFGWDLTFPFAGADSPIQPIESGTVGNGFYIVSIDRPGRSISGLDFANVGEPGEIRGYKWFDENGNGRRDAGEAGQPGVTIQLFDSQGTLIDEVETGPDGSYRFTNLAPQTYTVSEIVPIGQIQTFPDSTGGGVHLIDLQPTQIRIDVNFGNYGQRGSISGRKFNDANGNGIKDANELGVEGVIIYIDVNRDGVFNLGEPSQVTDEFGRYKIDRLVPGTYLVREYSPSGSTQTFPGGDGSQEVTVLAGRDISNINFGNRAFRDYGDAPAPYPTTQAQDGASHGIRPGFYLGSRVDADVDGQPNATATGDDVSSANFDAGVDYPVGDSPVSAFVADLDGLRGLDVVVVNQASNSISVLLNNIDGTFPDPVNYPVGIQPARVTGADLDGDGDVDLAVTNTGDNTVSILLNRGDGTFAPAQTFAAGMLPRGIVAGDLDGDGDADLAISNFGSDTITVLLNEGIVSGNMTFAPALTFDVDEGPAVDVTLGDINRDGRLDLIVANSASDNLSVLFNLGIVDSELTFAPPQTYAVGDQPLAVTVADFNRDGWQDVAVANANDATVHVLLNRRDGTFFPAQIIDAGGLPSSLSPVDIDGDGDLDLVVANRNSGRVALLVNNAGVFVRGADILGGNVAVYVVTGDFNADSGADVIVVNQSSDTITFLGAAGDDEDGVVFSPEPLVAGGPASLEVIASAAGVLSAWFDFNGDGDWNDPGEQVVVDQRLSAGVNRIFFTVPANAVVGNTFARFRFSDQLGLGPTGPANAGEVEDYRVTIAPPGGGGPPLSSFTNPSNPLDVNADGLVTLADVLVLVNDLRTHGVAHPLPSTPGQTPPPFLDPNGDNFVTLNDVLLVINGVLAQMAAEGEAVLQGEGENASSLETAAPSAAGDVLILTSTPTSTEQETSDEGESAPAPWDDRLPDEEEGSAGDPSWSSDDTFGVAGGESDGDKWEDSLDVIAADVTLAWRGAGK